MAGVSEERSGTSATRASGVNIRVFWTTLPSGMITALTPLVTGTTTDRPCSTARTRDIANCWYVISLRPKVALLLGTEISWAPSVTVSRAMSSKAAS